MNSVLIRFVYNLMPDRQGFMKVLQRFIRHAAAVLAVAFFVLSFSPEAEAVVTKKELIAAFSSEPEIAFTVEEGIYNLVNISTGKLLEAFDYSFDKQGRMHLDVRRGAAAQNFAIIPHSDGTYSLCPANEGGVYMLQCRADSKEFSSVYKSTENDLTTRFLLEQNPDGTVRIYPADPALSSYSLAESEDNVLNDQYHLAELQKNDPTNPAQKWKLELAQKKISVSLSISKTQTAVKLYTISELSAAVTPAAYADRIVWKSDDRRVALVNSDGSFAALSCGTTRITATVSDQSVSCEVQVVDADAFTWYSQCNMYTGGWNAAALSGLYFYADYRLKPFMIDGFNAKLDWMDEGCAICSIAMVLNNLGARMTEGYDFRSRRSGNLESDPYTVALANSYNEGSRSGSGTLYGNPINSVVRLIASKFRADGREITTQTYYYVTKALIKQQLDLHPEGVIVGMDSSFRGSHYLVFTKVLNPDAENPEDYQFLVCDPAAYDPEDGNNVLFEESTSYKNLYYRYSHMLSLITFTVSD